MTLRTFAKTEAISVGSLIACSFGIVCLGMLKGSIAPDEVYADPVASPLLTGAIVFGVGLPFAVFYGGPLYFWLSQRRRVTWLLALLIGMAPAILFIGQDSYMLLHVVVVGAGTASFMHLFSQE